MKKYISFNTEKRKNAINDSEIDFFKLMINSVYGKTIQNLRKTDTDILTYETKSENVYEDFFKWKDLFDFSNYSKNSKFFDDANKKVIGKMKDVFGGVIIDEFVGLKSKMYSIKRLMVKNQVMLKE